METSKQIREWGARVGKEDTFDTPIYALRIIQIQATLEVAAQIADLRETLRPGRLIPLAGELK